MVEGAKAANWEVPVGGKTLNTPLLTYKVMATIYYSKI